MPMMIGLVTMRFQRLRPDFFIQLLPLRLEREHDHRHDVVERHAADDHERRHARISVYILNEGDPEEPRCPVRRLDEFALDALIFPQKSCRGERDTDERRREAELYEFQIPHLCEVHRREILEEEDRQRYEEY